MSASTASPPDASTISRAPTFSPEPATAPSINTNVQPINPEPVELDNTSVSPVEGRKSRKGFSPDFDDEALRELNGEEGLTLQEREKRKSLLSQRSKDPAVLVNIPQTPGAEDFAVANREAAVAHAESPDSEEKTQEEA